MEQPLENKIKTAVGTWAKSYFQTTDVVSYIFADEEESERYIVVLAAKGLAEWQAVEAWLEDDEIVAINSLGEGLPPDNATWPW